MSTTAAELLAGHFVSLQFADIPQKLIDDSTTLTLETESGAVHRSQVDHPRGSIANPMTRLFRQEGISKTRGGEHHQLMTGPRYV
jgi:hypothetical protein